MPIRPSQQPCQIHQVAGISNYQHHTCCKGFKVVQIKNYIGTHLLLWLGAILYYIVTAFKMNPAFILFTVLANISSQVCLIILGFVNPGMLPKILSHYQTNQLSKIPFKQKNTDQIYLIPIKTHILRIKQCPQCSIYRPPRSSHCYDCNVCVSRFDHHCPWLGLCVAKNNYGFFMGFILSTWLFGLLVLVQSIIAITVLKIGEDTGFFVINILLLLYALAASILVGILVVLHIYLTTNNLTTNQFFKDSWATISGNPFAKTSLGKNILKVLGTPTRQLIDPQTQVINRQGIIKSPSPKKSQRERSKRHQKRLSQRRGYRSKRSQEDAKGSQDRFRNQPMNIVSAF